MNVAESDLGLSAYFFKARAWPMLNRSQHARLEATLNKMPITTRELLTPLHSTRQSALLLTDIL